PLDLPAAVLPFQTENIAARQVLVLAALLLAAAGNARLLDALLLMVVFGFGVVPRSQPDEGGDPAAYSQAEATACPGVEVRSVHGYLPTMWLIVIGSRGRSEGIVASSFVSAALTSG